jgi:nitrogenase molybdenum-iron protein alpha/beta subunit
MHTALALSIAVPALSTLVVGSGECAAYGHHVVKSHAMNKKGPSSWHWFYALDEHETVFGCREGLKSALCEMSELDAPFILVISTCVAHVIGEDLDGLLHELKGRLTARLFHVALPHFRGDGPEDGFLKVTQTLAPLLAKSTAVQECIALFREQGYEALVALANRIAEELKEEQKDTLSGEAKDNASL